MSRMAVFVALFMFAVSAAAQVESWKLDPAHSAAQFSVRHMGISTVRGNFTKVSGSAQWDPKDVTKSSLEAIIDASSVDTRVEMRDKDLRSPNFFDVEKYPSITFKSKKIERIAEGKLKITGDLTIRDTTKEVVLDVDGPSAPMTDPRGNQHMGASATTKVNRKDFGVNGAATMVGDEVSITLDVELVKAK